MKCSRCGFEAQEDFNFCPVCSEPQAPIESVSINPAADRVMPAVKDGMFLTVCILMSVYCVLSLAIGTIPIIQILATIFLWLTFAEGGKGFVSENHLRSVSGTIYAGYIINNVAFGIIAVCGVIVGAALSLVAGTTEFDELMSEILSAANISHADIDLATTLLAMGGWFIGGIFIFIAAIGLVINILGMRKIHRFIKSVYQSVMYCAANFENSNGAKNWLMFFGVCIAITAVSSFTAANYIAAIANGCMAAAQIIGSLLIKKHITSTQNHI